MRMHESGICYHYVQTVTVYTSRCPKLYDLDIDAIPSL